MLKSIKEFGISKSIVATVVGAALGLAILNQVTKAPECFGVCSVNYNSVMQSKGYIKGINKEIKNDVYLIDYASAFSIGASEVFAEKMDSILVRAKKGDTIVINITSPGGASVACAHDTFYTGKAKAYGVKTVAVVDYLAASCGYMLASSTDEIYALPGASVGNIGSVYSYKDSIMDAAAKYLGGTKKVMGTTRIKELMAGATPESDEDLEIMRGLALESNIEFKRTVLKGRGQKIDLLQIKEIFSGKLFSGRKALEFGLIDGFADKRTYMQLLHTQGYNITHVSYRVKKKAPIAKLLGF